MSQKQILQKFREFNVRDFRILLAIEAGMINHEFVPVDTIVAFSKLPESEALVRLDKIGRLGLVRGWSGKYYGYVLNNAGYDFLALNVLVKSNHVSSIGKPLGFGKEADIYEALSPTNETLAVKFHRLGRISFRQTKRLRSYPTFSSHWIMQSRKAAEREFAALQKLYAHNVSVPKPVTQNRHVVVMGKIEGALLTEFKELPRAKTFLEMILRNIRKAYLDAKIIHGDLSEFNIIINLQGSVLVIDWPQYIDRNHPDAERLLKRDIRNVIRFFSRRFDVQLLLESTMNSIANKEMGEKSSPPNGRHLQENFISRLMDDAIGVGT